MLRLLSNQRRNGYATLLSVLVLGAVALALGTALLLSGIDLERSSLTITQSAEARGLAMSCVEEALEQLRTNSGFTGMGSMSLSGGTCSYTVTKVTGSSASITTSGIAGTTVRKLSVAVDRTTAPIILSSWLETS